jgi:S-formylglutathione hydrolase FrmB
MRTLRYALALVLLFASTVAFSQAPTGPPVKPHEPLPPAGVTRAPQCANHHVFHSAALDRDMAYCVLLPTGYAADNESYPVLYLLHGLWGDENDWAAKTSIADYARVLKLIVVMPEGDDAWYTNSVTDPRNRYEDYIATDLVREIESKYRVQSTRAARFIAGLSMGGYGALKMGLKHPDEFSVVGAFSAARLNADSGGSFQTIKLAFGSPNTAPQRENNLYLLAVKADPTSMPYFVLTCGTSDPLRTDDLQMADLLRLAGIKYEYSEFPGAHQWSVWDRSVALLIFSLRSTNTVAVVKTQ